MRGHLRAAGVGQRVLLRWLLLVQQAMEGNKWQAIGRQGAILFY